jgi:4-amino-4-deoxy-L-arabinose transferase-like glycosyltransferase
MAAANSPMSKRTALHIFVLLGLSYLLFFYNLGNIALWDPDEPRQAIMAREMMERGDYVHPYLNGEPYLEKPPFHPWMIVAAARLTGRLDDYSARLPSAVAATFIVLILYLFGTLIRDGTAGLLSALMVMTNMQFLSNARESVMDMTFAFLITLAFLTGFAAVKKARPWMMALALLPAGVAVLTKGPVGLLIPFGALALYCFLVKVQRKFLPALVMGAVFSLVLASIWFLAAGEAYWREFLFRQNVLRFVKAFDHRESWLYYFPKMFFNFLPWSLLLPFALYHAWKQKEWLPLAWFGLGFIFFELSQSKRAIYLLPLYPAAAVLCGLYLRDRGNVMMEKKGVPGLLVSAGIILALLPIILALVPAQALHVKALRDVAKAPLPYFKLLFMALSAAGLIAALAKRRLGLSMSFLIIYLTTAGILYHGYYMPALDKAVKSPHLLSDAVRNVSTHGRVYAYGFNSPGLIYHLGKPVRSVWSLRETGSDKRDILVILEEPVMLGKIAPDLERRYSLLSRVSYERHFFRIYVARDDG